MTLDVYCGRKTTTQQQQQPTTDRNYSGEQKVSFESPVPVSKCLRANIYCNTNVQFDPQGGQTLLLKESEPFLLSLGSWTKALNLLLFFHFPGCGERWWLLQRNHRDIPSNCVRDVSIFNYHDVKRKRSICTYPADEKWEGNRESFLWLRYNELGTSWILGNIYSSWCGWWSICQRIARTYRTLVWK